MSKIIDVINIKTVLDGSEKIPFGHVSDKIVLLVSGIKTHVLTGLNSSNINDFSVAVSANATVTNNTTLANIAQSTADAANTNAGTALSAANAAQSAVDAVEAKTDQITITAATDLDAIRIKVNGIGVTDNENIITNAQIAI